MNRSEGSDHSCPGKTFKQFLEAFATQQDSAVRGKWTRDPLEVERWAYLDTDTSLSDETLVREIAGPERLTAFRYRFYPGIQRFGLAIGPPTDGWEGFAPEVKTTSDGRIEVTLGIETEVDTYTFVPSRNCWQLVRHRDWRD